MRSSPGLRCLKIEINDKRDLLERAIVDVDLFAAQVATMDAAYLANAQDVPSVLSCVTASNADGRSKATAAQLITLLPGLSRRSIGTGCGNARSAR
ncbi:hypothetical protein EN852_007850 [Mesorhizobium sp. M2E.F.Ca.ET.209.01.1.1]|uniref:hypothetical protein n=1 Tax=Mesorhizobium sp. M2E.F.Ca.ET.209.01.1.1 TaxID=2500526 RepID=UPI000FDA3212|nr:hypothetical protein [Mesorhizobium sp. M2E.F.Ca.ET.209.01.1.1]TGS17099.1 hypothetical protein EN852_007850 [Mesorhizobium sp. M2E.F.Ca.ET.209.01.1.1]